MPIRVNIQGYGVVNFPDGMTQEQIAHAIETELIPTLPRGGIGSALGAGVDRMQSAGSALLSAIAQKQSENPLLAYLYGATPSQAKESAQFYEGLRTKNIDEANKADPLPVTLESIGNAYDQAGLLAAAKQVPALVAGQLPQMVPYTAGAIAGGPIGWGVGIGSLYANLTGENLNRQAQEGRSLQERSLGSAALAAVPQTALEGLSDALMVGPLTKLLKTVPLDELLKTTGKGALASAKQTATQKLARAGVEAAKRAPLAALGEGMTEAPQQLLERAQAGLEWNPFTSEEARQEALTAGLTGALVGGAMGTIGGPIQAHNERVQEQARQEQMARVQALREQRGAVPYNEGLGGAGVSVGYSGLGEASEISREFAPGVVDPAEFGMPPLPKKPKVGPDPLEALPYLPGQPVDMGTVPPSAVEIRKRSLEENKRKAEALAAAKLAKKQEAERIAAAVKFDPMADVAAPVAPPEPVVVPAPTRPVVPVEGPDLGVQRAQAARETLAQNVLGKNWQDITNAERIAIDDLVIEGYGSNAAAPTAQAPKVKTQAEVAATVRSQFEANAKPVVAPTSVAPAQVVPAVVPPKQTAAKTKPVAVPKVAPVVAQAAPVASVAPAVTPAPTIESLPTPEVQVAPPDTPANLPAVGSKWRNNKGTVFTVEALKPTKTGYNVAGKLGDGKSLVRDLEIFQKFWTPDSKASLTDTAAPQTAPPPRARVTLDLDTEAGRQKLQNDPVLKPYYEGRKPLFDATWQYVKKAAPHVSLRFFEKGNPETGQQANYLASKRLITLAEGIDGMQTDAMDKNAWHEVTHAVWSLLSPGEQQTLVSAAKKRSVLTPEMEQRYRDLYGAEAAVEEEHAAALIAGSMTGEVKLAGKPRNIIDSTVREATRWRNWLEGNGKTSLEDLVESIREGQIGSRIDAPKAAARPTRVVSQEPPEKVIAQDEGGSVVQDTENPDAPPVYVPKEDAGKASLVAAVPGKAALAPNTVKTTPQQQQYIEEQVARRKPEASPVAKIHDAARAYFAKNKTADQRYILTNIKMQFVDRWARVQDLAEEVNKLNPNSAHGRLSSIIATRLSDWQGGVFHETMQRGAPVYDRAAGYVKVVADHVDPITGQKWTANGFQKDMAPFYELSDDDRRATEFVFQALRSDKLPQEQRGGMTQAKIDEGKALLKQNPWMQDILDVYTRYNRAFVVMARDAGLVAKDVAQKWMSDPYIPFYRQLESDFDESYVRGPATGSGSLMNLSPSKNLKGSEAPVADFIETSAKNASALISKSMRNIAAQRVMRDSVLVGWARVAKNKEDGDHVVSVKVGGNWSHYDIGDPLLFETMQGINPIGNSTAGKLFLGASYLLRQGVTLAPPFWVRNTVRDAGMQVVASGRSIQPLRTIVKGVTNSMLATVGKGSTPEFEALRSAGVTGGMVALDPSGNINHQIMKMYQDEVAGLKPANIIGHFIDRLAKASERSDAVVRERVYADVLEKTGDEAQAVYEALETLNFMRKGRNQTVRFMSMMVPFLNARWQGLDVLHRAVSRSGHGVANPDRARVRKQLIQTGMAMAAASSLYGLVMPAFKAYQNAGEEEKDNYWMFPLDAAGFSGLGKAIQGEKLTEEEQNAPMGRVPIPFEVGMIFKMIPERAIQAFVTGEDLPEDFGSALLRGAGSTLEFNPIPQIAKPAVEAYLDKDFYRGRPIVDPSVAGLETKYQSVERTSELAKIVGPMVKLSPMKVDHLVRGYTGWMGLTAASVAGYLMSPLAEDAGAKTAPKLSPTGNIPMDSVIDKLLGSFVQTPEGGGRTGRFYEFANDVARYAHTVDTLDKQGRTAEADELLKDRPERLAFSDYVAQVKDDLSQLRGEIRNIQNDKKLTAYKKRQQIREVRQQMAEVTSDINSVRREASK